MLTLAGLDAVSPEVLYASGRSCRISAAQEVRELRAMLLHLFFSALS